MDPIQRIFESLVAAWSGLTGMAYCGATPKRRESIALPALVLELVELEAGVDPGTEELSLQTHWEARLVVSDEGAPLPLWQWLQRILLILVKAPFPEENIGPAQLKQAGPDHLTPDYQGHRVWLIEWVQPIRIGENLWQQPGPPRPTTLSLFCWDDFIDTHPLESP